jgi:hypothetical protein
MEFSRTKVDKWLLIYVLLCVFGVSALFCFVQSEPVEFEENEVTMFKLELPSSSSLTFVSLSFLIYFQHTHSCPHKSSVSTKRLHHDISLIPGLNDVSLLGRSLGGCGS